MIIFTCTGIEMFRKLLNESGADKNVGVLLRGTKRDEVEHGQVLDNPSSITPHKIFTSAIYILSKNEDGGILLFQRLSSTNSTSVRPIVTGTLELPEGAELVMPADNTSMTMTVHHISRDE